MMGMIFKGGMLLGMVATFPAGSGDSGVWAQYGLAGLVVGFTMWSNHMREKRMNAMIDANATWVRETLLQALDRATAALEGCRFPGKGKRED